MPHLLDHSLGYNQKGFLSKALHLVKAHFCIFYLYYQIFRETSDGHLTQLLERFCCLSIVHSVDVGVLYICVCVTGYLFVERQLVFWSRTVREEGIFCATGYYVYVVLFATFVPNTISDQISSFD